MEIISTSRFASYLEKQSFIKETINSILDKWPKSGELELAISNEIVELSDQKDGTILVRIGFAKYLILFEDYYREFNNTYHKMFWLRITFIKESLNEIDRTPYYKKIGEPFYLDPMGRLYDGADNRYDNQNFSYEYSLIGAFGTIVLNDAGL